MKTAFFPFALAAASGLGLSLAYGIWGVWWLAWLAPVPVLAFAFARTNPVVAFAVALAAQAIGAAGELLPYLGVIPLETLCAGVALKAIAFAACVILARFVGRGLYPVAAPICFAALWTTWDYVAALGPDGAILSPAYSQATFPILMQSAALGGMWLVTFLIGLVAGLIALSFAIRSAAPALIASGIFLINIAYGELRMEFPQAGQSTRVVLLDSDVLAEASAIDRVDISLGAIAAYAGESRIVGKHAALIVLPEKVAIVRPEWREAALNQLQQASFATGATIVAGLDVRDPRRSEDQTWVFQPDAPMQNFGERAFERGSKLPAPFFRSRPFAEGGALMEAADHMNYPAMLRSDARATHAPLVVVPAWDFGIDASAQARIAIMRSVENGFALVRNARDGTLLLSDPTGRITAMRRTGGGGFTTLSAAVRTGAGSGRTLYSAIGDSFALACFTMSLLMLFAASVRVITGAHIVPDLRRRPYRKILKPAWVASQSPRKPMRKPLR